MKEALELRMYGLVPYNLSPIQQGIQFGHAVVEYGLNHFGEKNYLDWANNHKTFIILNGGTTNSSIDPETGNPKGTLNQHAVTLRDMGIPFCYFHEPDLGDQLTAVVFLVDEYVFNKEKYPDPRDPDPLNTDWAWADHLTYGELSKVIQMRDFLKQFRLA
jgi:hypothetical protein